MADWRRVFEPGGTYCFTLVTERRAPIFADERSRAILRRALEATKARWPFEIVAIVLMPDHLHTLWSLPANDSAYPTRIGWIKKEFTKGWLASGGAEQALSASRLRQRRRGVLQRRFWEHAIRSERNLHRHLDYLHYNPVKHGYVGCPRDWPWSSFHRHCRAGVYTEDWGCTGLDFSDLAKEIGDVD